MWRARARNGRLSILPPAPGQPGHDGYLRVTVQLDEVESPTGVRSDGTRIDPSRPACSRS